MALTLFQVSVRRAEMLEAIDQVRAEVTERRHLREAPYGETREGLAWAHYQEALLALEGIGDIRSLREKFRDSTLTAEERDRFVAAAGPTLRSLRQGAASRDATLNRSVHVVPPQLFALQALGALTVAKAQVLLEAGHPEEAVRVLVDGQQLAADLMDSDKAILAALGGSYVLTTELESFTVGEHYAMLSDSAKSLWVDSLRRIAAGIPTDNRLFRGSIIYAYEDIHQALEEGRFSPWEFGGRDWTKWRPEFYWRYALDAHVIHAAEMTKDIDAVFRLPRAKVAGGLADVWESHGGLGNPLTQGLAKRIDTLAGHRMELLARLDFLRHAIAVDAGVADPFPESPTSHPVKVERQKGQTSVSVMRADGSTLRVTVGERKKP